ncbi:glycine betaine ABC transporter substrate-binding protein [Pectinatus frisingensis]|uniref:glycine betaine ABC transporter substrate-binding protein n=1 Tax=Pectinatus frisingensis TaxID=865 RepID=UPI0018C4BD05|nr:glycine betaine ABC transporter substrate-binding protein [Pectinatus frisingensis]
MKKQIGIILLATALIVSLIAGCGTNSKGTIVIGSKDFTESEVVAEIYALALENAGYKVERKYDISSSVIHTSIVNKEIDLYPAYTGTALLAVLKKQPLTDPKEVYDVVKDEYEKQFQLTWLDYASANDGQGLAIRADVAEKLNIKNISDLQKHAAELRFGSQGEFDKREDGLPGLEKVYGQFAWKSSKVYDNSLLFQVLDNNEADVIPVYTTEGKLAQTDKYLLLEDDKHVWPPYNIAPVVRDEILKKYPDIADVLNKVDKSLTSEVLTKLNAKVDIDKEEYNDVAKEFYNNIK